MLPLDKQCFSFPYRDLFIYLFFDLTFPPKLDLNPDYVNSSREDIRDPYGMEKGDEGAEKNGRKTSMNYSALRRV